jgi:ABC-type polysaccharide/polyol phosphate export permease
VKLAADLFKPFFEYRYLLRQLTQRDIKARYKQSIVGYLWVLLNPLSQIAVYTFVFSVVVRFETGVPYPLFLFAGFLPWIFLNTSISIATHSLVESSTLLKKVAFPREIIPYAAILSKLVDFGFASLLFLLLLFWYQQPLTLAAILILPVFALHILLVMGISLLLSALNLVYRDVQYLANLLLLIWLYLSPIFYPLDMVPQKYVWLYELNPLVGLTTTYRSLLFNQTINWYSLGWSAFCSLLLFAIGFTAFKKLEKIFADIV